MVIDHDRDPDFAPAFAPPDGDGCFYCGTVFPARAQVIVWHGNDRHATSIFLHPACVLQIGVHLFRDVYEVEDLNKNREWQKRQRAREHEAKKTVGTRVPNRQQQGERTMGAVSDLDAYRKDKESPPP